MDYKTLQRLPMEFRIWDIANGCFLKEFQTDYGTWLWSKTKDSIDKNSFRYIIDHPDYFVVCQYVGIDDTVAQKRIFTYDIVTCWDHAADEGVGKHHTGVIEFIQGSGFYLNCNGVYWRDWESAENKKVVGNIFDNPEILNRR